MALEEICEKATTTAPHGRPVYQYCNEQRCPYAAMAELNYRFGDGRVCKIEDYRRLKDGKQKIRTNKEF